MKGAWIVAAGALLATAVVWIVTGSEGETRREAVAVAARDDAELTQLANEVSALRSANQELEARIRDLAARQERLESRPAPLPVRAPVGTGETGVTPVEERAAVRRGSQLSPEEGLEAVVLDVLSEREEEERREREEVRQRFFEERMNERMQRLTRELGLSSYQAEELRGVLTSERERREELFTPMRENGLFDRDAIREGMRSIHEDTQNELAVVLTQEQLERYGALESDDRFGGFDDRRRDRRGGDDDRRGGGGGGGGGRRDGRR